MSDTVKYDYNKYIDPHHLHRCSDPECGKQLSRKDVRVPPLQQSAPLADVVPIDLKQAFERHVRTAHYKVAEKLKSYRCRDCDLTYHSPAASRPA